jgi:hypothetical protein
MRKKRVATIVGAAVAVTALWAVAGASVASATHFRYGHYNWKPASTANTIEFTLQNSFRRDGYSCVDPTTGTPSTPPSPTPCTGPGGFPGIGDVFQETVGGTVFNTGDGGQIGSPAGALLYKVTSIDPANNWLFALALDPQSLPSADTTISYTYSAPGNYTAFTDSCCRISQVAPPNAHINNPDGPYRVETTVNVGSGNSSPVSALPPIVICPIGAVCSFQVPGADPNGDNVRFRLSTSAEAGGGFNQPGPPQAPNGASISSSGLYSWDTTGATLGATGSNTLYSTQVTIEDLDGTGAVKSKSALDYLIQLVSCPPGGCQPPEITPPPGTQPVCNTTQPVSVGGTLTFTVSASHPSSAESVTLNVAGLPPGATMSPQLPTSGNPVSSTFTWTPGQADLGTTVVVTFQATTAQGSALCPVTINVVEATAKGRMTGGGHITSGGLRVTHGFTLNCDKAKGSNNLQVNWGKGNKFHLESLASASCSDDPSISEGKPVAGFDTYRGSGTGRYNGQSGATAEWVFTDAGEPGKNDTFTIKVTDASGTVVLDASGKLTGNHQAHPE